MALKRNKETWILNATLATQDSDRRVLKGHLQIIDGRITKISTSRPSKISPQAQKIDASHLVILPGFIQTHVHLCQTLFRNWADDLELLDWLKKRIWVMEAAHTEQTLYVSALMGIHELLSTGTTCLLDMATVRHTEAVLDAVKNSGIRANVGKCLMDHPKHNPPGLRENTKAAMSESIKLFEKWNGAENGRIRVSFAPRFAISCTEKLLREVAQVSEQKQALIHTHASENLKEVELVRKLYKQENIEYLSSLGLVNKRTVIAHCIWLNKEEKQIMKECRAHITHCPSSNLKLASGIAPVPELRAQGINVALGADGAPCNNNLNMLQEMRLAALLHKPRFGPRSMQAQEVLDMATRNGALALGWQEDIGSIEVGKCADLVAFDLNALDSLLEDGAKQPTLDAIASRIVYSSHPHHIQWTMVGGKMLYEKPDVRTIPKSRLLPQVKEARRKIQKKTGLKA